MSGSTEERMVPFRCLVHRPLITYGGKDVLCILVRDLTDRKRMEEELFKAEKLDSLGILAGGIAHDFNNLLTSILSNLSLARLRATQEDRQRLLSRLADAERACLRAQDLTHQLLTFSQGGAPRKKTTSLSLLLRDSAQFELSGSNVLCEFSLPEDLWPADIDEGRSAR